MEGTELMRAKAARFERGGGVAEDPRRSRAHFEIDEGRLLKRPRQQPRQGDAADTPLPSE